MSLVVDYEKGKKVVNNSNYNRADCCNFWRYNYFCRRTNPPWVFDPGYTIFLPLLIFNFLMGFIYAGTGLLIWKSHPKALKAARTVFLLNLFIFLMISTLYLSSDMVAMESVIAMTFRTGVWFAIFIAIR